MAFRICIKRSILLRIFSPTKSHETSYLYSKYFYRSVVSGSNRTFYAHLQRQTLCRSQSVYGQLWSSQILLKNLSTSAFVAQQLTNDDGPKTQPAADRNTKQKHSLYRKLRHIVEVFWHGCKALFIDVKLALKTRRKLGLYHQQDLSKLSREEVRHMRQTRQDVVKTFPAILLFMIPFVGYIAPVIAYFYPKQLLSQQFWHPDQKKEIILEQYEKRSQYYLPLIKEVGVTCKEIGNKELLDFCLRVLDGKHPSNSDLLPFGKVFAEVEDLAIQKMPRYHLVKICKCWLIPTAWYLPRWYLETALRRRIERLYEDDLLIHRDGIDILTPECITQAVQFRGLDEASLCDRLKYLWLEQWVNLATHVSKQDVSFLAHAAVFKAANFEFLEKVNNLNETENR